MIIDKEGCQNLVIDAKLPSFNDSIKTSRIKYIGKYHAYDKIKNETISKICFCIRKCGLTPMRKIYLDLLWGEPHRRRDPDNIASGIKFILDALQKEKIIKNDGWKEIMGWRNRFKVAETHNVNIKIYETEGTHYDDG